jgi:hypothetical protein
MKSFEDDYLCEDGRTWYQFRFEKRCYGWRIYILSSPDYGSSPTDCHSTHRYFSEEEDLHYICWSNCIHTLDDARSIAKAWAEKTQNYIKFNEQF